jgi:multidrug efflux pump subunit AcrA (membrane-fusion protein)
MKSKKILVSSIVVAFFIAAVVVWRVRLASAASSVNLVAISTSVKYVSSTITADGIVTAQDQAILNFQTAGKLVYLPYKEGDKIYQGQTIASLDTYALKKQLQLAANTYQTAKNNTDQTLENNQAGVIEGQQRYSLDTSNKQGYAALPEANVIYDTVKHIVDNALLAKNSAQINVDLANYAIQLASLTSPLNGIITHEAVTIPGVNITPATTFTVADPSSMVFRVNVPMESIYYVAEGSQVTLAIDGIPNKMPGIITRIYPAKVVLASGHSVYQVDIVSDELKKFAKLDLTGQAIINTNAKNVALVPVWTVLDGKYIWIKHDDRSELKEVKVGKIHGNEIEIISGLTANDTIIVDPKFILEHYYQML